jgi:hypothetical protein
MGSTQVEYVDFSSRGGAREYRLRIRQGAEAHEYTVLVPNEAFLTHRLRYQDGPEICFLKLQRALAESGGVLPQGPLEVTAAELEEYRVAHAPKARK